LRDIKVKVNKKFKTFMLGVNHEKYIGIARAAETYMSMSDQKVAEDQAVIFISKILFDPVKRIPYI
jgi:hypothetical protein